MPPVPAYPSSVQPETVTTEGVAAMIPVANITLEDALLDNPNFRANIKLFEGQVFYIENWLVALQRTMSHFTEEWKRLNEATSTLNKRAEVPLLSQSMLSSQYTIPAMKLVGEAFRTTLALKNNFISEVNEKVLKPLNDFLKTDLKDFKDSKKVYDKALEKYESTLAKYNGQSRQKEPSALREEAFQLYDTRKAYIQAAMSCSMLCIKLQDGLDQLVLGVFLDLIATQHDYFSGNADHFGSMALQVLQLKTYMKDHKKASTVSLQELEQNKERYITDAIEYWKPSRSLKCYTNAAPAVKSTIGHAALGPAFAAQMAGQVPIGALLARPATISQLPTSSNRTHLPIPQFQTQQAPNTINASSSNSNNPANADAPTTDAIIGKTNSGPSLSLSSSATQQSMLNPMVQSTSTDLDNSTPTTKQGYLNIRIPQPRNRAPVWQRKYFFIQEGEFGFESVVSNPTVGSQVVQSERIAVLLCEVRYGSPSNSILTSGGASNPASGSQGLAMVQMERRFCFEVVCATQSYLLQAETEDDLMGWVNTFEAAKRDALLQQNLPRPAEREEPYSPMIPDTVNSVFTFSEDGLLGSQGADGSASNNEAEEAKPPGSLGLGWAANVPGVSLLLGSINPGAGRTSLTPDPTDADKQSDPTSAPPDITLNTEASKTESKSALAIDTSAPALSQQTKGGSSLPTVSNTENLPPSQPRSVIEVVTNPDQPTGHSQQLSEIEKLMTSSLHLVPKPMSLPVSEIPHYPMELIVRNRELHSRFHRTRVHSKEYVIHSWTCGYLDDSRPDKPIMVYGRVYLTQSGIYFYARGMSMETKRMYRFSSIRGIECEQKDISTEWRIETMDGVQHVFCQFTLSDTEYQVLHLIWTNVYQAKDRLPVKEIFRRTMLITNKPKGTAGSGSLAETESNHLRAGDGTMGHNGDSVAGSPRDVGDASINANDGDLMDRDDNFPSTLEEPSGPVSCNCPGHLEKIELEQTFKISAKTLNRLLFGAESPIWKEFHERRSNTVQSIGEWSETDGHKSRTVKFLMVVNNPLVKLNHTDCVETHTCEVEEEYLRYSYTVKSSVLAMPYSDAFTPVLRYCITFVNKNECKLTCSSGIEWHKNPLVKAMIKGAIIKGTAETVKDITEIIQLHLEHRKGHTSSTNTGNATGNHIRNDSANIMISLEGPESGSHSILLDPQNQGNDSDVSDSKSKEERAPGARRHTVSVGSRPSGLIYSGARVQGNWPTGAPPSFVPIGSKASRTKLLERPSRNTLIGQGTLPDGKSNNVDGQGSTHGAEWVKKNLTNLFYAKDEKGKQRLTTGCVYLVLIVSSLVNIWAAFNSQRMLDATWRMKRHEVISSGWDGLQGYPEPLHRIIDWGHSGSSASPEDGTRNVRVAARAVFLKDIEEQMLSGELEGFDDERTIDKKSFEIFMDVRDSFRSWPQPLEWFPSDQNASQSCHSSAPTFTSLEHTSPTPPTCSQPDFHEERERDTVPARYPWLLPHHRQWATRIIFQRDRVGILRHDLLVTFEVLNQLEHRLLEAEYVNWIMDERSRCRLWERKKKAAEEAVDQKSPVISKGDNAVMDDGNGILQKEEEARKSTLLKQIETDRGLDAELVNERLGRARDPLDRVSGQDKEEGNSLPGRNDSNDEGEDVPKRPSFSTQVTEDFCRGLEKQVRLFVLDSKN